MNNNRGISISGFVYEHGHVVWVSLQKLALLTVLDTKLYLRHLSLERFAHLLDLEYHLRVGGPSSLLHYLH